MRREAFVLVLLALVSSSAMALPSRVFVKSTGMDVGACPITAPCRSFSYAIGQVAAAGEVIALDTAGYGPFVVTQSVSVFAAPGATAFIAVNSGTGILIDSPVQSTDVIVLRGLALTGTLGQYGIQFNQGHSLAIEYCIINGMDGIGVSMTRAHDVSNPFIRMDHCTVRDNVAYGVQINNYNYGMTGAGPVGLTISNCTISRNGTRGVHVGDNARAVVTDTVIANNGDGIGAVADLESSAPQLDIERCTITGNSIDGVFAGAGLMSSQTSHGITRIAHNVITGNATGVHELNDGTLMTMMSAGTATNTIAGNVVDGTFSGSYNAK